MSNSSLDEYKQLYGEIGRNSHITQNVFVANVAVISGLIGYGLRAETGPIFLAPFAIIIPSLFFLASQLESTTRIAAYIKVFLETEDNGLNWESRWLVVRQKHLLPSKRKYTLSLAGLYGLLSVVCLALAYVYWGALDKNLYYVSVVPITLLVFQGARLMVRAFSVSLCEEYVATWEKLVRD